MGLSSAMNTSLNGMTLNETSIDVIGNNIANAGTNGFKASTALFATQLARTLSIGGQPTADNAGTNPMQVGLGASTAAIFKDFTQGTITNSTSPSDLAVNGEGFFIVRGSEGDVYTRDGSFTLSSTSTDPVSGQVVNSRLQTSRGLILQGYGVDQQFNIVTSQLVDLEIPIGSLTIAQETENVSMGGQLSPSGDVATQGSLLLSAAMTDTAGGNAAVDPITAGTLLSSVYLDGDTTALFTVGQTLSFTPEKGGRAVPEQTLTIAAGSTVQDLLTLMDNALGIQSGGTIQNDPNSGGQPGVGVTAGGEIQVVGNRGTANDINIAGGDLLQNGVAVPVAFTKQQSADGESAVTDFIVYDSLGQQVVVTMTAVLDSVTTSSTNYRYFLESPDDSDPDPVIQNGLITFDSNGDVSAGGSASFTVDRNNVASASPLQISVDFSNLSGVTSPSQASTLALTSQDGFSAGTLSGFNVSQAGIVSGVFDNGVTRTLGQVVLATFSNNQGLIEAGENTFREGVNSGPPTVQQPGTSGAGTIRSGAIELSNTDIGRNLVDLIVASTNYRGNARVISSVQQLFDELLLLGR